MRTADDQATARAALDDASRELRAARATLDSAAAGYAAARHDPGGAACERARAAWSMALLEWADLVVRREGLVDAVTAERRRATPDGGPPGTGRRP
jgi:hypothetical protein